MLSRCPLCKGDKGKEVTSPDGGDVRWIICAECGGMGEVEIDEAAPAANVPSEEPPGGPVETNDVWLGNVLEQAHRKAADQLRRGPDAFESLDITHSPPRMARLFFMTELKVDPAVDAGYASYRIVLHHVFPALSSEEMYYHSHDCPSVVQLLEGSYEHTVGTRGRNLVVTQQGPGTKYAMTDPKAWHSVRPVGDDPIYTLMVQGEMYPHDQYEVMDDRVGTLGPLTDAHKLNLWWNFCRIFNIEPDAD